MTDLARLTTMRVQEKPRPYTAFQWDGTVDGASRLMKALNDRTTMTVVEHVRKHPVLGAVMDVHGLVSTQFAMPNDWFLVEEDDGDNPLILCIAKESFSSRYEVIS